MGATESTFLQQQHTHSLAAPKQLVTQGSLYFITSCIPVSLRREQYKQRYLPCRPPSAPCASHLFCVLDQLQLQAKNEPYLNGLQMKQIKINRHSTSPTFRSTDNTLNEIIQIFTFAITIFKSYNWQTWAFKVLFEKLPMPTSQQPSESLSQRSCSAER